MSRRPPILPAPNPVQLDNGIDCARNALSSLQTMGIDFQNVNAARKSLIDGLIFLEAYQKSIKATKATRKLGGTESAYRPAGEPGT